MGRNDTFVIEFDLKLEEYVPLPQVEVHKKKESVGCNSTWDLDATNTQPQARQDIVSLTIQLLKPREIKTIDKLCQKIKKVIS